ncbi:hypothetical protein CSUB01_08519 [Colletotrichum sublineola]|uniref:CFEM domain-containing protein n=1 Tax=Colletotrichum sublineola TaxID=1173701 RepID=A0A066X0R9_COLSU|nr:hypothetical protein CSUB01_08519 [Colletotrichum sublineola]
MRQSHLLPLLWLAGTEQARAASAIEVLSQTPACAYDCVIDSLTSAACSPDDVTSCVCANITLQAELSICAQTYCSFEYQLSAAVVEGDLCAAYPKASRSWTVERTIIVGSVIVFPVIALRLFARAQYAKRLWADDYATILGACIPVDSIWDRNITDRRCVTLPAVGYSSSALAIAEDVAILLLPIPQVWRLQIPLDRRLGLLALFSLGFFACLTSMIRMKFLVQYTNTFDATWDYVDIVMWSFIEQASALLCCSLPAARLFIVNAALYLTSKRRFLARSPNGPGSSPSEDQAQYHSRRNVAQRGRFSQREGHSGGILITRAFEVSWRNMNQRGSVASANNMLPRPAPTYARAV